MYEHFKKTHARASAYLITIDKRVLIAAHFANILQVSHHPHALVKVHKLLFVVDEFRVLVRKCKISQYDICKVTKQQLIEIQQLYPFWFLSRENVATHFTL